jgi:hypothetical protein
MTAFYKTIYYYIVPLIFVCIPIFQSVDVVVQQKQVQKKQNEEAKGETGDEVSTASFGRLLSSLGGDSQFLPDWSSIAEREASELDERLDWL